jgi:hypothetical protein
MNIIPWRSLSISHIFNLIIMASQLLFKIVIGTGVLCKILQDISQFFVLVILVLHHCG